MKSQELKEFVKLIQPAISSVIGLTTHKLLFMLMPNYIRGMIPLRFWPDFVEDASALYDKVFDAWNEHDKTWEDGDEQLCLIDTLKQDLHDGKITKSDAITTLLILLFTAGDTTATCMQNIALAMAKYPEVQKKAYAELRAKNFDTRSMDETPYFRACISEVLRFLPSIYRSLIHTVNVPTKIGEYGPFPQDTLVMTGYTSICFNPKYFKDPFVFNPNRFLDENGNYKKDSNLIPFNVGKRSCPGQVTAYLEMNFFLINVLK